MVYCVTLILKKPGKDLENYDMIKAYIKEDDVTIGISIVTINAVKPLWELDIAKLLTQVRIHQETHGFSDCLAIVDVVITIKIQNEGCICKDCRHSNLEKRNYMTLSVNTLIQETIYLSIPRIILTSAFMAPAFLWCW